MNIKKTIPDKIFKCKGCGVNTLKIHEYYMLKDETWEIINPKSEGMLCIGCVEKKLGRELKKDDFLECPVNWVGFGNQSARLVDRLTRTL